MKITKMMTLRLHIINSQSSSEDHASVLFLLSISNILRRFLSELKIEQTRKTIQLYIMHINTICSISKLLLLLLLRIGFYSGTSLVIQCCSVIASADLSLIHMETIYSLVARIPIYLTRDITLWSELSRNLHLKLACTIVLSQEDHLTMIRTRDQIFCYITLIFTKEPQSLLMYPSRILCHQDCHLLQVQLCIEEKVIRRRNTPKFATFRR